jgi:hypothetical protein
VLLGPRFFGDISKAQESLDKNHSEIGVKTGNVE